MSGRIERSAQPPRVARALLRLVVPRCDRAFLLGDLDEEYAMLLAEGWGARRAGRWYWSQAVGSVIPSLRRRRGWRGGSDERPSSTRRIEMLSTIWQDIKFGARTLAKSPLSTSAAIVTLALGVGASTAIFSVVEGVVLRPLAFADPGHLARITVTSKGPNWHGSSEPEYVDMRSEIEGLDAVAAYDTWRLTLGDSIEPRMIRAVTATAELLPMLGVRPILGRFFTAEEDRPDAPRVALLSYGLWQRNFGGSPDVLGATIVLDDSPITVIGVMPRGFAFPTPEYEVWMPQRLNLENLWARNNHYLGVVARLRRGMSAQQVQAELDVLAARSNDEYAEFYPDRGYRIRLQGLQDSVVQDVRTPLLVLLVAVGFVLLIACVNVANLLLSRGESRKREIAVRAALGAGKRRLGRQLLTESLLLAVAGGLAGLALALAGGRFLLSLAPDSIPRLENVGIDARVLGFALALVFATGAIFGIAPALHATRSDPGAILKSGGRSVAGGRAARFLRRSLVVAQLAMAVLLVLGAGMMIRSFANLYRVDPGIRTSNVLTFRLSPSGARLPDPASAVRYYEDLLPRLEALPGVRSAGAVARLPLASGANNWSFQIEGREVESVGDAPAANVQQATPDYFESVALRLVRGRTFEASDDADAQPVVIISERMARTYWPGEDPIGQRMRVFTEGYPWMEIVGIVADVKHFGLDAEVPSMWYVPYDQGYVSAYVSPRTMTIVMQTESDPQSLVAASRATIRAFDPSVPVSAIKTMGEVVAASVGDQRFTMALLSSFAIVALLLAAVGAYGVISYGVSLRRREIGLRIALGARSSDVLRQVIREGLVLAMAGSALGLFAGLALSGVLGSLVFGVSPTDPLTYAAVVVILALTALAASLLPALRASAVDPMVSLRSDQG